MDKINIPEDIDSMRIKHLFFLKEMVQFEKREPTNDEMARLNASFVGMPPGQMRRYARQDNLNLFKAIVETFGTYTQKEIPLELTYPNSDGEDITFEFVSDFSRLPLDWFIDRDESDFEQNPIDLASFCYIEKGMSYGEPDEHDNVKNPRSTRNKIFTEHMPLSLYLDIQGFFLLSWNVYQKYLDQAKRNQK